ncbi:MAG: alkaline phosphatase D family protein [Nitrococcus sp.]|nr:alkaline phosphatase D family protein [Nitrococcus sp.]
MSTQHVTLVPLRIVLAITIIGAYALCGSSARATGSQFPPITHGVAAGDVTTDSAVIWSRTNQEAVMHVMARARGIVRGGGGPRHYATPVDAASDYTGKVFVEGLDPDTAYTYQVWFSGDLDVAPAASARRGSNGTGHFHTAPSADDAQAVTLAWAGDIGGQNVCRDVQRGFPGFTALNAIDLDFFIGLGDLIYADGVCEEIGNYGNRQIPGGFGPSADIETFWAHWKYNREEPEYQKLLANTPFYAIWDDHEVVNNFGPLHDTRDEEPYTPGEDLLPLGRRAFLDYNPVREDNETPKRLYRTIRWGQHVELFILDTRQYRDANREADDPELRKSVLGRKQLVWLKQRLATSDATWKIIVSSIPMSIPTGDATERDGWADFHSETGFEQELVQILRYMKDHGIGNTVWITTDVHFAEVFVYTPFLDDPSFQVHELITGPFNAGVFPNLDFDTTLNPQRLFFYPPPSSEPISSYKEAVKIFNFGVIRVHQDGRLTAQVINANGERLYEITLQPK